MLAARKTSAPGRRLHTSHSAAVIENSVRARSRLVPSSTVVIEIVRSAASPSPGKSAPLRPVVGKLTRGIVVKPIRAPRRARPSRHAPAMARRSRHASWSGTPGIGRSTTTATFRRSPDRNVDEELFEIEGHAHGTSVAVRSLQCGLLEAFVETWLIRAAGFIGNCAPRNS
jgi:hypothetical protein